MSIKTAAVVMASGYGKRFGSNKLLAEINGKFMSEYIMESLKSSDSDYTVVVSRDEPVLALAEQYGLTPIYNDDAENNPAYTIRLGVSACSSFDGCMLCVADQPYLTAGSINKLIETFSRNGDKICRLSWQGTPGNPVIFPKRFFEELLQLEPGQRGKAVMRRHPEDVLLVEAESEYELSDIDTTEDICKNRP